MVNPFKYGREVSGRQFYDRQEAFDSREATVDEIVKELRWDKGKVQNLLKINTDTISLDTPVGEDGDSCIGDFISDSGAQDPEVASEKAALKQDVHLALATLTKREREVLDLRFGITDGHTRTLEEVGAFFHVTRERIRQIEAKALRKLRHPLRAKYLIEYARG